jgi:hypothetical protein
MMNPLSWSREHQLGLLVAALIGAALATVLGYFVYAVGWGEGALPFENWIWRPLRGAIWWALFGAVIGGAIIFVRNLMREPVNSAGSSTGSVRSSRPHQDWPQDRPQDRFQDRHYERPQDRSSRPPRSRS